jgi:hypothetical protein
MNPQPASESDHHTRRSKDGRVRGGPGEAVGGAVVVTASVPPSLTGGERAVGLLRRVLQGVLR